MAYSLGIDVGTTYTSSAICRADDAGWRRAETFVLGARSAAAASVVFIGDDGRWLVGDGAEQRAHDRPELVVREFKRRIGDPLPLVVGEARPLAETLAAGVVRWVVDLVSAQEGAAPDSITLTYPANWTSYKRSLMREALDGMGLADVSLVSEPVAAAAHYAAQTRVPTGSSIAVYDLGGGTFDAAVVRKLGDWSFDLLGTPGGSEHVGGLDFDEAIFRHVQRAAPLPPIDLADGDTVDALRRLRRDCTEAKEALSADTEATIPVLVPDRRTRVRIIRAEFEEFVRDDIVETIETLAAVIAAAGVAVEDLDAVLLVGGSSRIPLVAQLATERLARPVVVDADPRMSVALGAALIAAAGLPQAMGDVEPVQAPRPSGRPAAVPVVHLDGRRPRRRRRTMAVAAAAAAVAVVVGATIVLVGPLVAEAPAVVADDGTEDATESLRRTIGGEALDTRTPDNAPTGAAASPTSDFAAALANLIAGASSTTTATTVWLPMSIPLIAAAIAGASSMTAAAALSPTEMLTADLGLALDANPSTTSAAPTTATLEPITTARPAAAPGLPAGSTASSSVASVQPTGADPATADPATADPATAGPAPAGPAPTGPPPTGSAPSNDPATDLSPIGPAPTDEAQDELPDTGPPPTDLSLTDPDPAPSDSTPDPDASSAPVAGEPAAGGSASAESS